MGWPKDDKQHAYQDIVVHPLVDDWLVEQSVYDGFYVVRDVHQVRQISVDQLPMV